MITTIILQDNLSGEHHVNLLFMQSFCILFFLDRWVSHILIENFKKDTLCPDIVHRPPITATNRTYGVRSCRSQTLPLIELK